MRNGLKKQLTKKRLNCLLMKSLRFFLLKILLRKMMCNKNNFCKTWVFASCLKLSSHAFCGKFLIQVIYFTFVFLTCHPIQKTISQEVLPNLVEKKKELYVLPQLVLSRCKLAT
jgi:hypothetical protein